MAGTAELIATDEARAPEMATRSAPGRRHLADAVRMLATDAAEASSSEELKIPLGMADAATALWTEILKFDAADPRWMDRDRFVLSPGRGSLLLYALLHLTGHAGMGADALQLFRQPHAATAATPAFGEHPAIEATTGPPGQGLSTAVGMAVAERMMAARFGKSLVDHRTWVIADDDDLADGLSHEAMAIAGQLRLEKLTVLYHDGSGTPDGEGLAADPFRWLLAHGWAVRPVDGHDPVQLAAALSFALRARRPTLIACRTGGGRELPHSLRFGRNAPPFVVPDQLAARWRDVGIRGAPARRGWLRRAAHHPMRGEFERVMSGRLPDGWFDTLAGAKSAVAKTGLGTAQASRRALELFAAALPELACGSAGCSGAEGDLVAGMGAVAPGSFAGRRLRFGVRAHGMAACLNGMALHGGLRPCGVASLLAADAMRPALRLAASMRQRVIHVLQDGGPDPSEDGSALQTIEQLASLRAMPNVFVFRPANAIETAECWDLALRREDGPSLLVLTSRETEFSGTAEPDDRCAAGGYVLVETAGRRDVTLIATGAELAVALAARDLLAVEGCAAAVVSLPCWDLFAAQDEAYRAMVLGDAPRVGIEAACGFGWERWLGTGGAFVGRTGFGAPAPGDALYRYLGITPEAVVMAARGRLN